MTEETHQTTQYKPRFWVFILLGLIILGGSIFMVRNWIANKPVQQPRQKSIQLPFVETQPIQTATHQVSIRSSGFVDAKYRTDITAQVSGKVTHVAPTLEPGQLVKKGDVLVTIDKTDYLAARSAAKATLATARSNYTQEKGRARQAARDIKRLKLKATDLALRKPQLNAALAAIDNAKAQLSLAEANLKRTKVIAPFDALVETRNVAPGEMASGATVLARLVSTERFTIKLSLQQHDIHLINVGDSITLSNPLQTLSRTITLDRIDPGFDSENRTIAVYGDIDNPLSGDEPVRLSAYLDADIAGKSIPDSQWLPNSAIIENRYVWYKKANNQIDKLPIQVIYRRADDSLVRYPTTSLADNVIIRPKPDFYAGEEVTTEKTIHAVKAVKAGKTKGKGNEKNTQTSP